MSDPAWPDPPAGFELQPSGRSALYVDATRARDVRRCGLSAWEGWDRALAFRATASGRGATAVIDGGSGARWRLKVMRRGGRLSWIWRDRYPVRRLVATLRASMEAKARGVPTADPVALLVETNGIGWARGAMALDEIEGAVDLARLVVRREATHADLLATLHAVRVMHDRGVRHPDLNLGNVLLRPVAGASPDVFLIDFDRATFASAPLTFHARQSAIRRLERSCAKLTGSRGPCGPGSEELWYTAYAGDDAELAGRLARGRPWGRLGIAAHRLLWKRKHP